MNTIQIHYGNIMITECLRKHEVVKQMVLNCIAQGQFKKGSMLPSRQELAQSQNVSMAPVRRAIAELQQEGVIQTLPGRRGYFVTAQAITTQADKKLDVMAFTYEGQQYHPELSHVKMMPQLLFDEVSKQSTERHLLVRAIPFRPVDADREDTKLFDILAAHRVIVMYGYAYQHWIRHLESQGCYVIQVSDICLQGYNWIAWDRVAAYTSLMKHLIDLGHRKIGYMGDNSLSPSLAIKYNVYLQQLYEHQIPWDSGLFEAIATNNTSSVIAYQAARRFVKRLGKNNLPSAVVVDTDFRAQMVMEYFLEIGLRIPQDISVVSIDNRPESANVQPALTTVGPDWQVMSRLLLDTTEKIINDQDPGVLNATVPFKLVVRQSSAPPARVSASKATGSPSTSGTFSGNQL